MTPKDQTRTAAEVQLRAEEIISGAQAEAAHLIDTARAHVARDRADIDRLVAEGVAKARADELQVKAEVKRASFAELAAQAQAGKSFFERALEVSSALHAAAQAEQHAQELTASVDARRAELVQVKAEHEVAVRERDAIEQRLPALRAEAEELEQRITTAKARIAALINGVQQ
jgi:chromosome segregation ATPase